MLRTVLAVLSLGAAVAIFSCSDAKLGGAGPDGGRDSASDACNGNVRGPFCYRGCDATYAPVDGGACPDSYTYVAAYCVSYGSAEDGSGPTGSCPVDAATDGSGGTGGTSGGLPTGTAGGNGAGGSAGGASGHATAGAGGGAAGSTGVAGHTDGSGPIAGRAGTAGAAGHTDGSGPIAGSSGHGGTPTGGRGGGAVAGSGGVAGSGSGSGGTAGGGDGAACNDLLNNAPSALVRSHTGDRPADGMGAGGVVVDGVYDLASIDYYRSIDETESPVVGTIRISNGGTLMEEVSRFEYDAGAAALYRSTKTLAVAGAQITEAWICPGNGSRTDEYTATSTTLMLSNPLFVNRYVRR